MSSLMFAKIRARQYFKYTISAARIKLLYQRITLTRFTSLYCFFAIISCFILSALQIVSLIHDSEGVANLAAVIQTSQPVTGIAILQGDTIELCSGLPGQAGTLCIDVINFKDSSKNRELALRDDLSDDYSSDDSESDDEFSDDSDDEFEDDDRKEGGVVVTTVPPTTTRTLATSSTESLTASSTTVALPLTVSSSTQARTTTASRASESANSTGRATFPVTTDTPPVATSTPVTTGTAPVATVTFPVLSNDKSEIGVNCVISIMWLNDVLHDIQREDVVLFVFQIWLLFLSFVTILNESIPHLGAGLIGHVLGAAWSVYRLHSTQRLMDQYRNQIVPNACNGQDFMGDWWENRINDAIPLVALQAAALIVFSYISFKLFNIYTSQTFQRAGASTKVYTIYKLVLVFSVCLQVSGFISVASTAMWISKVTHAPLIGLVEHSKLYIGIFSVTLVLEIPWLVIGWICVRRESRIQFAIFCLISALISTISITMFSSNMYRYIFGSWPFFATLTVTAFILLAGATILGLACRMKFGQGLAQYLQVNEVLEAANFTPVYFTRNEKDDIEKFDYSSESKGLPNVPPRYVEYPVPVFDADPAMTRGTSVNYVAHAVSNNLSSEALLGSDIVPVTRMSVFSKALKRFSVRAPSPSVRSLRAEPEAVGRYSGVSPIKAPPPARTSSASFTNVNRSASKMADPSMINSKGPVPPSPVETLSTLSYYGISRLSFSSDRTSIKSLRSVGLPANPRSKLVSSFKPVPF